MEAKEKNKTAKFALPNGLVLGFILVLIGVVMYVTGMQVRGENWLMYAYYVIFPVFIGFTIYNFRKENNGYLSLVEALKVGVGVALISGVLYAVFYFILINFIDPGLSEQMLELGRENIVEMYPNLTDEQIEAQLEIAKKLSSPAIGGAFFVILSVFFGFIYSLILGLIFKKTNPHQY